MNTKPHRTPKGQKAWNELEDAILKFVSRERRAGRNPRRIKFSILGRGVKSMGCQYRYD